jgi:hypothetical protein
MTTQRAGGVSRMAGTGPGAQEGDFTVFQIALGVRLSDAGLGDYWDDVDALVRNRLVEQQYVDLPSMRQIAGLKPDDTSRDALADKISRRLYRQLADNDRQDDVSAAISPRAPSAYTTPGTASRVSIAAQEWRPSTCSSTARRSGLNVASWLPYEGKVELTNKQATRIDVRIPGWVDIKQVKCFKNNAPIHAARHNHRLLIQNLVPGDVIRLEFPQPVSTNHYYLPTFAHQYEITWRGSTVVDIKPRDGGFRATLLNGRFCSATT